MNLEGGERSLSTTCLLIVGKNKKKIQIPSGFVTLEDLKEEVRRNVNLSNIIDVATATFQIHDKDFEEFVDMNAGDEIPDKSKVNVIGTKDPLLGQHTDILATPRDQDPIVSNGGTEEDIPDSIGPQQFIPVLREEPLTFSLKPFPSDIEQSLKKKEDPSPSQRRRMVDSMFEAMISFTIYPSHRFYVLVASTLIGKYAHLRDTLGSGYDSWTSLLRTKFKNSRRKIDGSVEEVRARREINGRKGKRTSVDQASTPSKILRVSAQNEQVVCGEDEKSIDQHRKWLQKEFQKRKPDEAQVTERMKVTFANRQQTLQDKTIAETLEAYPFLKDEEQFLRDFTVLTGKDADRELLSSMNKYSAAIAELFASKDILASINADEGLTADAKKYRMAIATIEAISSHFREDLSVLIQKNDNVPEALTPVLTYSGSSIAESTNIQIYVEKQRLFACTDFLLGLESVLGAYWVFNLQYHPKLMNTLTFIELLFLKLSYTKPRACVIRAISRLEKRLALS